ncbi:DoxX family protein [Nocardia sp. NBC_00565]|uniref:DoxX family protein n=1 Tax=Nocardia sp. NBC_00565 TaxID=2975993 RepID=UPI002E81DD1F|nr:DoxX family protein [Nocardia sp. NBC_00565]WUC07933.1 DoxX family protein [Nocardia sp. NBC_00565]
MLAALGAFVAAGFDVVKADQVRETMKGYGIPQWALTPLAVLKALGGLGLLIGLAIPPLGLTAAICLVLFFLGAVLTILRAKWYSHITHPLPYLALAVASLGLFAFA